MDVYNLLISISLPPNHRAFNCPEIAHLFAVSFLYARLFESHSVLEQNLRHSIYSILKAWSLRGTFNDMNYQ